MPTTPVNMIGAIPTPIPRKEEVIPLMAITRARAQAQATNPEPTPKPLENQEVDQPKATPLEYPDPELEIGRLKAIQDWIEEERLRFRG